MSGSSAACIDLTDESENTELTEDPSALLARKLQNEALAESGFRGTLQAYAGFARHVKRKRDPPSSAAAAAAASPPDEDKEMEGQGHVEGDVDIPADVDEAMLEDVEDIIAQRRE